MRIEALRADHLQEVLQLLEKGRPYVLPHHHYIYWMLQRYYAGCNYVAEEEGQVIGFLGAVPSEERRTLFIWQIIVDPSHRGKGLGVSLLQKAEEYARYRRFTGLEFSIDTGNKASLRLFRRYADRMESKIAAVDEYRYGASWDIVYRIPL